MRLVTSAFELVAAQARLFLLVALSCAVLAAALMIAFNEMGLLRPTEAETLIIQWQRGGAAE